MSGANPFRHTERMVQPNTKPYYNRIKSIRNWTQQPISPKGMEEKPRQEQMRSVSCGTNTFYEIVAEGKEMREILFRGKRIDNGEWVEGFYAKLPKGETEIQSVIERKCDNPPDGDAMWRKVLISYEVDPKTICQYTGLTDKNGRNIFEGDIISYTEEYEICDYGNPILCPNNGATYFPRHRKTKKVNSVVRYDVELCSVVVNPISEENYVRKSIKDYSFKGLEVIGNIFDNPELIGEKP